MNIKCSHYRSRRKGIHLRCVSTKCSRYHSQIATSLFLYSQIRWHMVLLSVWGDSTILVNFRAKSPPERMLTLFCNKNFKLVAGFSYCRVWLNCLLCGVFSIACVQTGTRLVSVVWSRGVSTLQGLLMY